VLQQHQQPPLQLPYLGLGQQLLLVVVVVVVMVVVLG
jgi:hypothetical protein